jgi:amino-acid N-acetyltransferase
MISALTAEHLTEPVARPCDLTVRKAAMRDIAPLLELINGYAAKGIMLPRTEFELSENMRDFSVAYDGDRLLACGALHFYSPVMGEIRSLAVAEGAKTRGVGRQVVEALVREAREYCLGAVFAFTYVPEFFAKAGFAEVERGELPLKAWKDCLRCPKFQSCDEIAVLRVLDPAVWAGHKVVGPGDPFASGFLVQLPNIRRA